MESTLFGVVFIAGMAGGFFNTFVGAGSLLTIPVLMLLGLPPHVSIATNRLGVIGSDIAGWYAFHKKGMIDYRHALTLAVPSLAGAYIGAQIMMEIDKDLLRKIVASVTFLVLLLIMTRPGAGIVPDRRGMSAYRNVFAIIISFVVGIYGGFYGAGAGTFLFYILILVFGETFLESAGTHEIANLSFSVIAAAVFAYNGVINYTWTVPLFIGSFFGSLISAHYAEKIGNVWLKRIFFAVVLVVTVKLLF